MFFANFTSLVRTRTRSDDPSFNLTLGFEHRPFGKKLAAESIVLIIQAVPIIGFESMEFVFFARVYSPKLTQIEG